MTEYPEFPQEGDPAIQREWYEKQIFDLKQLLEISKLLNSTLDYNNLMDSILFTCMGQMKVLKAGLFTKKVLDDDHFTLHRNHKGFDFDNTRDHRIPEHSQLVRLLSQEYRCFTLQELGRTVGESDLQVIERLEPTLIVPLKAKGIINGIIVLGERIDGEDFSDQEKDYLMDIAMFAAIAIQNAVLFEMSTTDMMTKLKLKHFFNATLAEQMEEAGQSARPISLVMIDIDHFKELNDTYGHICGDQVLRHVTTLIKEHIRQNDTAARYGGEEFAILLPETNKNVALAIAERIRQVVESSRTTCGENLITTSISIGVAEYQRDRDSLDDFIGRADAALYRAKNLGRNRVENL